MIEAIIHYQDSTLIMDLPRNIYDIHEKLMSIGCPTAPGRIPLTDNEDDALRVKLYGRIEMGNHLIRILSEQNTLADANALASVVLNASDDIKLKLGEKIVKDQYDSIPEIVTDIRQMTYDAGPIKRTFYCPLVLHLWARTLWMNVLWHISPLTALSTTSAPLLILLRLSGLSITLKRANNMQ